MIANVLQMAAFETPYRRQQIHDTTEVVLGLLPQSHIFALVVICHAAAYRGDQIVVLPKYDLRQLLLTIQTFSINTLFLVGLFV